MDNLHVGPKPEAQRQANKKHKKNRNQLKMYKYRPYSCRQRVNPRAARREKMKNKSSRTEVANRVHRVGGSSKNEAVRAQRYGCRYRCGHGYGYGYRCRYCYRCRYYYCHNYRYSCRYRYRHRYYYRYTTVAVTVTVRFTPYPLSYQSALDCQLSG